MKKVLGLGSVCAAAMMFTGVATADVVDFGEVFASSNKPENVWVSGDVQVDLDKEYTFNYEMTFLHAKGKPDDGSKNIWVGLNKQVEMQGKMTCLASDLEWEFNLAHAGYTGTLTYSINDNGQAQAAWSNVVGNDVDENYVQGGVEYDIINMLARGSFTATEVPEPASLCLFGLGSLALLRRKRA